MTNPTFRMTPPTVPVGPVLARMLDRLAAPFAAAGHVLGPWGDLVQGERTEARCLGCGGVATYDQRTGGTFTSLAAVCPGSATRD